MADEQEVKFAKEHIRMLKSHPVQFPNDYQQPLEDSLAKVPVIAIDLPPPPAPKTQTQNSESISVTFKSTKPAKAFTLSVAPTDTIATVKTHLAKEPGAPPADAQRLLLKGKVLADGKLLKEYAVKGGDVVNIMLRPGFEWDWDENKSKGNSTPSPATPSVSPVKDKDGDVFMHTPSISRSPSSGTARHGHVRIPSVVLSPSPSQSTTALPLAANERPPSPIPITIDASDVAMATSPKTDAFHAKIASPAFWERLYTHLKSEFESMDETEHAFESFLRGAKGNLTPSEIAKIRDTVGIVGMGGT